MSNTVNRSVNVFFNAKELQDGLDKATAKAAKLEKQLADIPDKTTPEYLKLEKQLQSTTEKVSDFSKRLSGELAPSLKQVEGQVRKAWNEMNNLPVGSAVWKAKMEEFNKLNGHFVKLKNEVGQVGKVMESFASKVKTIAVGVLIGNTVEAAVTKFAGFVSGMGQTVTQFESKVRNLSAITGLQGKELDYLADKAIKLSMTSSNSAADFVEAMKLIGSAKPELLANAEALALVTKEADRLAKASGIDLPDAAKRLTDTLNQYGAGADEAAKYVDALAAAAKFGAAEVADVSSALLEFGTQAKNTNVSIFESAGLIELLAEKGIKGAEAGTKLRNVLLSLNAVEALDTKAIESLRQAGVNTDLLRDKSLSLEKRLIELGKVADNDTALVRIFGKENYNAAQIVLQNIPRYAQLSEQIKAVGVANEQAAQNTATLSSAWNKFTNVLNSYVLALPTEGLTKFVLGLTSLIKPAQDATEVYREQRTEVQKLSTDILPLLTRYDELKGKTTLTTDEQTELNDIIKKVGDTIPTTISQFDEYGRALDINTGKAREFVEQQQAILLVKNKEAIDDAEEQLKSVSEKINRIFDQLKRGGQDVTNSYGIGGATSSFSKFTDEQIKQRQQQLASLQQEATGLRGIIAELKGEMQNNVVIGPKFQPFNPLLTPEQMEAAKIQAKEVKQLAADVKETQLRMAAIYAEEYNKQLEKQVRQNEAAYNATQATITRYYAEIALQQKEAFANGLISEEAYHITVESLMYQELEAKKKFASEYKSSIEKAGEDEAEFDRQIREKIAAERIRTNQAIAQSNEQVTEQNIANIQREQQAAEQAAAARKQIVEQYLGFATSVLSEVFNAQASYNAAELDEDKRKADARKETLQRELDQRKISQGRYNAEVAKMDKELRDKERKQKKQAFVNDQAARITETVITTAVASVNAYNAMAGIPIIGPGLGAAAAAATAAFGALKIALIASQPVPEFEKGDKLDRGLKLEGPSHKSKSRGIWLIDPESGRMVARAEGKEWLVNKDSSSKFDPLLDAINRDDEEAIDNWFMNRPRMNATATQEALAMMHGYKVSTSSASYPVYDDARLRHTVHNGFMASSYYIVDGVVRGVSSSIAVQKRKL